MKDDMTMWIVGGLVLYIGWQWYQQYVAAQVAAVAVSAPVVSPVPQENWINTPTPMSATIY